MKQEEEPITGLPENAFRELKPGEVYNPLMSPDKKYSEVNAWSVTWGILMAILFSAAAAYLGLKALGYRHERKVMLGAAEAAHVSMAGVHRVASLVKRWILGTHQGSVQPDQLDFYLDEFTFRFNRRASRSRGMLFYRLMAQAVHTPPVTYNDVAQKRRPQSSRWS